MLQSSFKAEWRTWYPSAPPIGHLMRQLHAERWLRIHSLPESKRYAETPTEWAELLARHNAAATALLEDGGRCVLVTARFADLSEPMPDLLSGDGARASPAVLALAPQPLGVVDDSWPGAAATRDDYADDTAVWLYAAPVTWKAGSYDALIRAVANDEERFILVARATGQVYAPYDGGADLFFRTPAERDAARAKYSGWLSTYPGGL